MLEILKAILYGIVEGITEWLPISSTGHLILLKEIMPLSVSEEFWSMFEVVIQLGAIVAVLVLFFHKLNPFSPRKTGTEKRQTWDLWGHVVVAMLPAAVLGVLLDDWLDAHLYNYVTVAVTLIAYGVAFVFLERNRSGPGNHPAHGRHHLAHGCVHRPVSMPLYDTRNLPLRGDHPGSDALEA